MSADISVVIQIHIEWERDDPEHRGVRCEGGYRGYYGMQYQALPVQVLPVYTGNTPEYPYPYTGDTNLYYR